MDKQQKEHDSNSNPERTNSKKNTTAMQILNGQSQYLHGSGRIRSHAHRKCFPHQARPRFPSVDGQIGNELARTTEARKGAGSERSVNHPHAIKALCIPCVLIDSAVLGQTNGYINITSITAGQNFLSDLFFVDSTERSWKYIFYSLGLTFHCALHVVDQFSGTRKKRIPANN